MSISLRKLGQEAKLAVQVIDRLADLDNNRELVRAFAALVDSFASDIEQKVVKMPASEGADAVFVAKVKAEGARALAREIQNLAK